MVHGSFFTFIRKKETLFVFVLSLLLSFIVFGNGISGEFVFDDVTVVQNRGDLKNPDNFWNLFISPYHQNMAKTGLYRPLTMVSYALNHRIFGSSPISFHVISIVIHALNSFLVFWLVNSFFKFKQLAFLSFLLFLFHPIHTEAVTSIVGRAELLGFLWSMLTVFLWFKNKRVLAATSFLLALTSKESALTTLPIIFFSETLLFEKKFTRIVKKFFYFIVPLTIYTILRYLALGKYLLGDATTTIIENPLKFLPFKERVLTAFKVLYMYMERLIWPIHLSADYSYNTIVAVSSFTDPAFIAGVVFFVILLWVLISRRMRKSIYVFGSLVFLFPYLIISNLIFPVGTIMGERLMYFPSLGFVVVLAFGLAKLIKQDGWLRKIGYLTIIAILCFYGFRTFIRNKDWQNHKTLFFSALKKSSEGLITNNALAGVYIRNGEWNKAKEQLEISRNIYENNALLQNLLGIVADHEGNYSLAEEKYKRSLELNPDTTVSDINLAELYLKQGRFDEAGRYFLKVINFYATKEYILRYAYIQITIDNPDEALEIIDKYFGLKPLDVDTTAAVGTAYFVKGNYEKALLFLKKSRELGNKASEIEKMIQVSQEKTK